MSYTYSDIAKMIDHSLLNPALTVPELEAGCQLALLYDVASVCILPYYAARCAQILAGSTVQPSTTIGFPHGGHTTAVKLAEADASLAATAPPSSTWSSTSARLAAATGNTSPPRSAVSPKPRMPLARRSK